MVGLETCHLSRQRGWDWLARELPWQEPGLWAVLDQPDAGRHSTIEVPAEGLCWFGNLAALTTLGLLLQAELWEAISVAIKPNRVQVIGPGDTLAVLAARYGTTYEALRQVNPKLQDIKGIAAAKGDSLTGWRGGMAPAPEPCARTIPF